MIANQRLPFTSPNSDFPNPSNHLLTLQSSNFFRGLLLHLLTSLPYTPLVPTFDGLVIRASTVLTHVPRLNTYS